VAQEKALAVNSQTSPSQSNYSHHLLYCYTIYSHHLLYYYTIYSHCISSSHIINSLLTL
jgi:hypothetical protein